MVFVVLSVVMTYPLARLDAPVLPQSDDAYFSVWRLAWVAHRLLDPRRLFDANIFHPASDTLAYSDAMLALGVIAAPAVRLGLHPVVAHNLLLIAAFATAGWAAYALCYELTQSAAAAAIGGTIFAFAPYRFAHIGHLELLWTAPMPLALLVLHRALERGERRHGIALGGLLAFQAFCSLYYAAFLVVFVVCWMGVAAAVYRPAGRRAIICGGLGLTVALLVTAPYGCQYAQVRDMMGPRSAAVIRQYSAEPADYLRVSPESNSYPFPRQDDVPDERSLFPGATALALAVVALVGRRDRLTLMYGVLAACAFDLSLGSNGTLYPALLAVAPSLTSLRVPARFAALLLLVLSVLAARGAAALISHARTPRAVLTAVLLGACLSEYWSAPIAVRRPLLEPSAVYRWLSTQQTPAILELPLPVPSRLWHYETTHQYMSQYHWLPLINGYSAFAPASYVEALEVLQAFPSPEAVAWLRALGVELVIVHAGYYAPADLAALVEAMVQSQLFEPPMTFDDPADPALVFRLQQ